jgi:chromosome segregation ATPase
MVNDTSEQAQANRIARLGATVARLRRREIAARRCRRRLSSQRDLFRDLEAEVERLRHRAEEDRAVRDGLERALSQIESQRDRLLDLLNVVLGYHGHKDDCACDLCALYDAIRKEIKGE